ncbi:mfs monosaccharide [Ceraceosorus bombacis]|uniref:Mfs monosaccharide n=1 Tax=Ceraceosorus bombacis TaxID=401625 RepID=A0A0P1BFR3_9BASI|nr:mfs monosaccharide [Ceraceosorus bombacis]
MVFQLPVLAGSSLRGKPLTAAIALISGVGFLLFGYDQGVMSGLFAAGQFSLKFPQLAEVDQFGRAMVDGRDANPQFDSNVQGAVTAIYEIGAMIGSLIVLWKGDAIGRRTSIAIGATVMIIGATIMTASYEIGQFTAGRIITGIGNGMNTSTIPMWQSELSKAHNRGLLVLIEGSLIAAGIMISYWIDYGFFFLDNSSVQWRFPIAFQAAFAIVLLIGILCLPESPRWLIKKGQIDQASRVLAQVDNTTENDPEVQTVVRQLRESIEASEQLLGDFSYKELLQQGPEQNFYRTAIAFTAQAFQQLSGINLITYYATTVFLSIVPDRNTARLLTCGNGTEYFAASIVALFLIDTLGRRKLMISTAFMMSASMAVLAGTVSVVESKPPGTTGIGASYVAALFLYLFNTFFAFGWLGMTWLYPPEITPIRIRAPASAIATSSNWIFNFLVVMITPPAFASIKYQTYIIFAVLNMSFVPVIYAFFPETKRRGLEEMDLMFAEAHETKFWHTSRFMTEACYLSVTKPYLSSEELDVEIAKRYGSQAVKHGNEGYDVAEKASDDKADKAASTEEARDRDSSRSGSNSHE